MKKNNNRENLTKTNQERSSLSEKQSKKFQQYFENSINISEIENRENKDQKQSYLNRENKNKENSIKSSIYLDEQSIQQLNKEINTINTNNNVIKKKLTKEDLDNIPLPIFSCIYCSNDYLPFKHLSNEILVSKYYYLTSVYDMKLLDKIIQYQPLIDQDHKNHRILDIIIKNTDYLKKYYNKKNSMNFYCSQKFKMLYINNNLKITKYFLQRIEDCIIRKKNKDLTNKKHNNNRCSNFHLSYKLSFHNNSTTNDILNNLIGSTKNNNTIGTGTCAGTGSYSSINNIVSFSLNNNENTTNNNNINIINNNNNNGNNNNNNNNILCLNNLKMMENIMEKIEKNGESESDGEGGEELLNIFGNQSQMQIHKKINKNEISFEEKYYDIWNPIITIISENEKKNSDSNNEKKEQNTKLDQNINKNILIDNIKNNYLEKRKIKTNDLFTYSQTTCIKNKVIINLNNNKKKLNKLKIKKGGPSETNADFFKNNEKLNINKELLSNNNFNNNLFHFKSTYMHKNKRNKNNQIYHNFDNKNILNIFNSKPNYYESLSQTKEENKMKTKKESERNKLSDLDKFKNMTININNNGAKNLLFLLKHPKSTSHSNQMSQKMVNININNRKINNNKLSSFRKNLGNRNYILFKPQENSSARTKNAINKKFNFNSFFSDFNNIYMKSSRNMSKKRELLFRYDGKNLKNNSIFGEDEHFKDKSGYSSCTHFQINLSKILYKNEPKEKISELMKNLFKTKNYKININDFINPIKKVREIKNKNIKKIDNNLKVPLLNKRSLSVSRYVFPKMDFVKKII